MRSVACVLRATRARRSCWSKAIWTRPSVRVASLPPARMARRCAKRLGPSATRPRIFACWQASPAWVTERSRWARLCRASCSVRRLRLWTPRRCYCSTTTRLTPCARPTPICSWRSMTSTPPCSSPAWSPMCRVAACSRSTVLRRRSLTKPPSSACGHTSSSPGSRAAVADWRRRAIAWRARRASRSAPHFYITARSSNRSPLMRN